MALGATGSGSANDGESTEPQILNPWSGDRSFPTSGEGTKVNAEMATAQWPKVNLKRGQMDVYSGQNCHCRGTFGFFTVAKSELLSIYSQGYVF